MNVISRVSVLCAVAAAACLTAFALALANSTAGWSCQAVADASHSIGVPRVPGECWTASRPWALAAAATVFAVASVLARALRRTGR